MYQRKSNLQNLMIIAADAVIMILTLGLANFIRHGKFFRGLNRAVDMKILVAVYLIVYLVISLCKNFYKDMRLRGPFQELLEVTKMCLATMAGATFALYFVRIIDAYSRVVLLLGLVFDILFTFVVHQILKRYLPFLYRMMGSMRKVLLAAPSDRMESLVESMKNSQDLSYEVKGLALLNLVSETEEARTAENFWKEKGYEVLAYRDTLLTYCQTASLDEIILCGSEMLQVEILTELNELAAMGLTLHLETPLMDLTNARTRMLTQIGTYHMVTYANRVLPMGQTMLKRLMDIVGGLVGFVILVLLTIVLAPIIKLDSPGPVFFAQKRVGRNGRIFSMYKFRSMNANAEAQKKELMKHNEMDGLMFKMEDDPRITKVGRFLRKTSLDEFPQFVNILKGDMSLVGTRPPTLDEFEQYKTYHKKRLSFRPGLTGMWQVSGRSDITDFEEIVKLDVEYIDNWSLWLDIKILLKTVLGVLRHDGAR